MEPKKLIRKEIIHKIELTEWDIIEDKDELNQLYQKKVAEEVEEIKNSEHKDINEFVDLITVSIAWAKQNGFSYKEVFEVTAAKIKDKGDYSDIALTNLNPNNPSNRLYFEEVAQPSCENCSHWRDKGWGDDGIGTGVCDNPVVIKQVKMMGKPFIKRYIPGDEKEKEALATEIANSLRFLSCFGCKHFEQKSW